MPGTWSWRERALVLLLCVVWGFNFIFIKLGLSDASALWFAFLRAVVGLGGTALVVAALRTPRTLDARGRRDAMLIGLPSTAIFYGLTFAAIEQVLPGFASILIYTFPLWVAIFSPKVLGHPLTRYVVVALVLGFGGVVLVSQPWTDLYGGLSGGAVLELLGAAVAWAIGTVLFQRRFLSGQLVEANLYQLAGGVVGLGAAVALLAPTPLPRPSVGLLVDVIWLGILGTAVAYVAWSLLLGRTRAVTLSAYLFLVPIVALVVSAFVFAERLDAVQLVGVALVFVAIYAIGRSPGRHDLGDRSVQPEDSKKKGN
jgi:O-acetylserine/cysteine efflux transporter